MIFAEHNHYSRLLGAVMTLIIGLTASTIVPADEPRPLGPSTQVNTPSEKAASHIVQHRRVGYLFDLGALDGIDTLIVDVSVVPEHTLLPGHRVSTNEVSSPSPNAIFLVVQKLFSKQPWISVKLPSAVPVRDWSKPNVLFLNYAVSARQPLGAKNVKVGSLALQLEKFDSFGPSSAIPVVPATYPFLIPNSEASFNDQVAEGVRYLTSYLVGYLADANGRSRAPSDPSNEYLTQEPFKERLGPRCGTVFKDQVIPCAEE